MKTLSAERLATKRDCIKADYVVLCKFCFACHVSIANIPDRNIYEKTPSFSSRNIY